VANWSGSAFYMRLALGERDHCGPSDTRWRVLRLGSLARGCKRISGRRATGGGRERLGIPDTACVTFDHDPLIIGVVLVGIRRPSAPRSRLSRAVSFEETNKIGAGAGLPRISLMVSLPRGARPRHLELIGLRCVSEQRHVFRSRTQTLVTHSFASNGAPWKLPVW
jgi:hypothetical protein